MIISFFKRLFNSNAVGGKKEGTVKFFNYKKGFGFITIKDSDEEIFVHTTNVIGKIKEKNKVTFNIEKSDKGLIATNVKAIK
jgi:CspA family cold shock protein